ncbi:conjugal transfer nickase/helicase domain-containing protein [Legionella jordanis]|uniref:Putative helicase/relaxase n=1 Tax=Legionella jordanis TaxID=456 RepID=A0A0W0VD06_9GAMM|nr:TraI domain-containing protein [Legionella jordanis]KTD17978.1 putative helicase/relaxase [Legionella jordanis]RMX02332.1 helicase [Legionella jordanis]RMX15788.1 helicase [Legionella jordanis]VEH13930.1 putative helicase/relaxase [Legionella jordanis]HAT8714309.1 helicase [Legionella jordanis]
MFHRYGKKTKSLKAKSLSDLIRIIQAPVIMAEEKRKALLMQIRDASTLEEPRFDSLCLSLIHNFVNHCQNLPETANSYYSQPGGLLDHALNRTEAALSLFKQYVIKEGIQELSEEQKLWQYALFSAAMLQGIGKLQIDFSITLYDNNGQFLKQWNPLLENLAAMGSHYSYEFLKESDEDLRRRLNLLLARMLMPISGFSWIASNPQVLAVWLALLNEDLQGAGTLGAILIRANAIALQRYFNQFLVRHYGSRGGRYARVSTFAGGTPESINEIEQQIGIEFIQWLSKSLDAGRIMVNKAPLFMVPGGMLMSADMFKLFVREHPEFKNWQAVQNAFLSLGLHRVSPDGNIQSRFEQANNQQMHTGVVFSEYAVALPNEVQVYNLNTGKSNSMSATELIHQSQFNHHFTRQQVNYASNPLLHLNAAGQWQQPANTASLQVRLQPGVTNGA